MIVEIIPCNLYIRKGRINKGGDNNEYQSLDFFQHEQFFKHNNKHNEKDNKY